MAIDLKCPRLEGRLLQLYSSDFFDQQSAGSRRSAERVVPIVLEFLRLQSVVDVGCGVGAWLSVFKKNGVKRTLGIDGNYVDHRMLEIPADDFLPTDLTRPVHLDERFDLAVSLEVGEHLPPESAAGYVESLTRLAPVVLFSAAIPHQGGVGHLNEQWPDYWRDHFARHGYEPIDCIRRRIWSDPQVQWWYAQDVLLYVARDYLARSAALSRERAATAPDSLSLVHPQRYLEAIEWERPRALALEAIRILVPERQTVILADAAELDVGNDIAGRPCIPFTESDGRYNGPPEDDESAIAELERRCAAGASFIAFAWPAFWWLEHYRGLSDHLRSHFPCVLENERLVLFDLRRT